MQTNIVDTQTPDEGMPKDQSELKGDTFLEIIGHRMDDHGLHPARRQTLHQVKPLGLCFRLYKTKTCRDLASPEHGGLSLMSGRARTHFGILDLLKAR